MGLKQEERDIRGLRVISQQLPARKGFTLMPKLGAIMGPALGMLQGVNFEDGDIAELAPALGSLFGNMAKADVDSLVLEILAHTQVVKDNSVISLISMRDIDQAFEGNLPAMLESILFAIQLNYSDFFDAGSLAKAAKAGKAATEAAGSEST